MTTEIQGRLQDGSWSRRLMPSQRFFRKRIAKPLRSPRVARQRYLTRLHPSVLTEALVHLPHHAR